MKKILALTIILISFGGSAFAAGYTPGQVTNSGAALYGGDSDTHAQGATNPLVRLSTNVSALLNIPDPAGTPPKVASYVLVTKHYSGSKLFGTASDSTNIYFLQGESGKVLTATMAGPAGTNKTNDTAFPVGSGWTAY